MSLEALRAKYGERAVDAGLALQPTAFAERLAQRDALDQHFTRLWMDFAIEGMNTRPMLDTRTRLLVLIGQFTMAKSARALEETIHAALAAQVAPREIVEIIIQCAPYGGRTMIDPALETFYGIAKEQGLLDALRADQLPLDSTDGQRSREAEEKTWHPDDAADPRLPALIGRHGWHAVSRGLTARPRHHLNVLAWLDSIDAQFAGFWVKFCYGGLYARAVVNDRTRLLCTIGDCLAVGDTIQVGGHMRGALRNGATAREILEVIFLTAVNFGMPSMLKGLEIFLKVLAEDKRLDEIGNPQLRVDTYGN